MTALRHLAGLIAAAFGLGASAAPGADLSDICGKCQAERFAHCGGFLEGAAFDHAGSLWVVDVVSGAIRSIAPDGSCTQRGTTGGSANGARFHKDGRLFIADNVRGILALDTRTMKLETVADSFEGGKLRSANDLVFDDAGGLYFTDPHASGMLQPDGNLFYLPPGKGAALQRIATGLAFPNGIVLSADRKYLLVGQYADKSVVAVPSLTNHDPFHAPYILLRTTGGIGPDGMAQDVKGNLYWAIFGAGAIGVADAGGIVLGTIPLPPGAGTYVTNLAFRGGWLYVTEGTKGEVWRLPVRNAGAPLYDQR